MKVNLVIVHVTVSCSCKQSLINNLFGPLLILGYKLTKDGLFDEHLGETIIQSGLYLTEDILHQNNNYCKNRNNFIFAVKCCQVLQW